MNELVFQELGDRCMFDHQGTNLNQRLGNTCFYRLEFKILSKKGQRKRGVILTFMKQWEATKQNGTRKGADRGGVEVCEKLEACGPKSDLFQNWGPKSKTGAQKSKIGAQKGQSADLCR